MSQNNYLSTGVRKNALKKIIYPVWFLFALTILLNLFIDIPLLYQFLPLLASVILLGLPHGAVDHLLIPKANNKTLSLRWMLVVSVIYLILGGLYLIAWYLVPLLSFVFFILITWFHWGEGEIYIVRELFFDFEMSNKLKIFEIFLRGGAPMILPLIAFPEYYRFVAESIVSLFTQYNSLLWAEIFFEDSVRSLLLFLFLSVCLTQVYLIHRHSSNNFAWRSSLIEFSLLIVFFLTVPPILAVGLYFCFWHSFRHVFRYSMLDENSFRSLERGSLAPSIKNFFIDAFPLTLGALFILAALYTLIPVPPENLEDYISIYLVLISVLTLPHIFFMLLLDKKQDIF